MQGEEGAIVSAIPGWRGMKARKGSEVVGREGPSPDLTEGEEPRPQSDISLGT